MSWQIKIKNKIINKVASKPFISRAALYFSILILPFLVFYWLLPFYGTQTIGNDYGIFPIEQQLELQYSIKHNSFPLYVPGFAGGRSSTALTLGQIFHPVAYLSAMMPGYWNGYALEWNTFWRLVELGIAHLAVFILLLRLRIPSPVSYALSFITVYNLRMLDSLRYGASHESYTGYIFLCAAMGFYFLKPTKFSGPVAIITAMYLLITSGHPQMMYYGLLGAFIVALAIPFTFGEIDSDIEINRKRIAKFYINIGICSVAGVLLAGIYIIPFYFDFVADNAVRVGREYMWAIAYSDSWGGAMASLFAPLKADVHGAFGSSPIIILVALVPLLPLMDKRVPAIFMLLWVLSVLIFMCSVGDNSFVHHFFWKYFPLAQTFRVPGRINMVLPFIVLLILAWIFNSQDQGKSTALKTDHHFPASVFLTLCSLTLFTAYNLYLADKAPEASYYTPAHILRDNGYPPWINLLIFWLGLISLLLVAARQLSTNYRVTSITRVCGVLLCLVIVVQGIMQIRYGTWIEQKKPTWTLDEMNAHKEKSLLFQGNTGYGLESPEITRQMKYSFLETSLLKFYRKNILADDQDTAYQLMATERNPDMVVIERKDGAEVRKSAEGFDKAELTYSSYNKLTFTVESEDPGYVVLSQPFSPKWRGTVDEKPTKIYRANGNLIAVHMDRGKHSVSFQYFSKAAFAGILTTCLTLLILGLFFSSRLKRPWRWLIMGLPVTLFAAWHLSLYNGENLNTNYFWDSSDFPPTENLAYGQPSRMSSIWTDQLPANFYAGRAVDGDREKQGFVTSQRDRNPWWEVDLGKSQKIGDIVIYVGPLGIINVPLIILVSNDGVNYTSVARLATLPREETWRFSIPGVSARLVRLASLKPGVMSFQEIEIYHYGYKPEVD